MKMSQTDTPLILMNIKEGGGKAQPDLQGVVIANLKVFCVCVEFIIWFALPYRPTITDPILTG